MKTKIEGPVRVRFPPSPTGFLHVGGARTAIYNELLRQSLGGSLVLRIEDTDRARSDQAMTEQILSALRWIGVTWDEGPTLQSAGVDRHRSVAWRLLAEGKAYHDFVAPEAVAAKRDEMQKAKQNFRYKDHFPPPSADEAKERMERGEPFAVRFVMGDEPIVVSDIVRGEVTFGDEMLDDLIILRSDGTPTYHLTVVCDDIEARISHVIRGEDHLSNTPKHIALYRALDEEPPVYGHLPLIMGPGKKRLSKRHGAASAEEFREQGLLPQALYNYLAFLGWSPGDEREIMSREELIGAFTAERLGSSAAVFDPEKLAWVNAQYMSGLPLATILEHLAPFLPEVGIDLSALDESVRARFEAGVDLHRTRAKNLIELASFAVPYVRDRLDYDADLCAKFLKQEALRGQLEQLIEQFGSLEAWTVESTEVAMRSVAEAAEVKAGVLIHPTRMALSCSKAGPSLFDLVAAMGQEASLRHLGHFVAFLRANA